MFCRVQGARIRDLGVKRREHFNIRELTRVVVLEVTGKREKCAHTSSAIAYRTTECSDANQSQKKTSKNREKKDKR